MSVNSLDASTVGEETTENSLSERLMSTIEVLEQVAADRRLLAELSVEDRVRLLQACGKVYCSDPVQRRQLLRATQRLQKAKRIKNDQNVLSDTGIRKLRKRPVFTTPNIVPPEAFEQQEIQGDEAFGEVVDPQNCYICKQDYSSIHHFYDQLCPTCAALNFQKRTELADLRGRVALLTGGRVKIGYQAGVKLLRVEDIGILVAIAPFFVGVGIHAKMNKTIHFHFVPLKLCRRGQRPVRLWGRLAECSGVNKK